jgi:CRP/FNR family transcriptional regulator
VVDLGTITSLPIFQALGPAAQRTAAQRASLLRFREVIFSAGRPSRGLFVIASGRVRITTFRWGRSHALHEEQRGATLGDIPLYAGGGYPATAVAADETTCVLLTRDDMEALLRADPGWAWVLLERLAERLRGMVGRLERNTAQAVPGRLETVLLERHAIGQGGPFALGKTQREVAEDVGTVREVVVRTLARFRRAGAIRAAGRGRHQVRDPRLLWAIAEGER